MNKGWLKELEFLIERKLQLKKKFLTEHAFYKKTTAPYAYVLVVSEELSRGNKKKIEEIKKNREFLKQCREYLEGNLNILDCVSQTYYDLKELEEDHQYIQELKKLVELFEDEPELETKRKEIEKQLKKRRTWLVQEAKKEPVIF